MKLILKTISITALQIVATGAFVYGVFWVIVWFFFKIPDHIRDMVIITVVLFGLGGGLCWAIGAMLYIWFSSVYENLKYKAGVAKKVEGQMPFHTTPDGRLESREGGDGH